MYALYALYAFHALRAFHPPEFESCGWRYDAHQHERSVIARAHAAGYPGAIVVHDADQARTHPAVGAARRPGARMARGEKGEGCGRGTAHSHQRQRRQPRRS